MHFLFPVCSGRIEALAFASCFHALRYLIWDSRESLAVFFAHETKRVETFSPGRVWLRFFAHAFDACSVFFSPFLLYHCGTVDTFFSTGILLIFLLVSTGVLFILSSRRGSCSFFSFECRRAQEVLLPRTHMGVGTGFLLPNLPIHAHPNNI